CFSGENYTRAGKLERSVNTFFAYGAHGPGNHGDVSCAGNAPPFATKISPTSGPLEKYVKIVPDDPAGHYQLAIAYDRTGRKESAAKEMQLQRETAAKAPPSATTATPQ